MVKTLLTPQQAQISIHIPQKYVGRQIEVLFYATDELTEEKITKTNQAANFKGLLTAEEGEKYHTYLKKARTESDFKNIQHMRLIDPHIL